MFTVKALTALVAAAGIASAVPTKVSRDYYPTETAPWQDTVTHIVVAGRGGALVFDPENVVAQVGEVVEFHFLPKNHSVAQSSFDAPCAPIDGDTNSFFSGFQPTAEGQAPNVFQITVTDTKPIWYYCAQQKGNHCQMGMAGVINQNFDGPKTLAAYKLAAAGTGTSVIPPVVGAGGVVIANPRPNDGI